MKENEITAFIQQHKENFQANFLLTKPKNKVKDHKEAFDRMINLEAYQTDEVVIDFFYKKISRVIK